MIKKLPLLLLMCMSSLACTVFAQGNIRNTSTVSEQVLLGHYNPASYGQAIVVDGKASIIQDLQQEISADSLRSCIVKLGTFYNRNTYSDTVSATRGIGASRRWVYSTFKRYSAARENRLLCSWLEFDTTNCNGISMNPHRNIMAVLPGTDTSDKSVIIVEGHIDSRCENVCDTICKARGIEDNASGTALVIELARVMSKYSFKNTIVFAVVTGEEQGLYGGSALAAYCQKKKIKLKAVLNNDVIGGILCGKTASPPTTCKNEGDIDSTHVRIFSVGGTSSIQKALARFCKLEYVEEIMPTAQVPMTINIMAPEDRTGRGGDHIPFDARNFAAVRFTASHEAGDANPTSTYTDRQHSFRDTLGVDTNNDGQIDSFFVSFHYLQRNTVINGLATAMAAMGPQMPAFTSVNDPNRGIVLHVTKPVRYKSYKINMRRHTSAYDLDLIYTFQNTDSLVIPNTKKDSLYFISMASMDSLGTESIFTTEVMLIAKGTNTSAVQTPILAAANDLRFLPPVPNPANSYATFKIALGTTAQLNNTRIEIIDMTGKRVASMAVSLLPGVNEIDYNTERLVNGLYEVALSSNGQILKTVKMSVVK